MQDLKAGHILGCTPWRMQLGDIFGVTAAALVMFFVLSILHLGDIKQATSSKLAELQKADVMSVEYIGSSPMLDQKTYTLSDIRAMQPEMQNEVLGTNAGFGGEKIPAPQASLMAVVAKSIMEKKTEWILILVGMFMGLAFILMQIKSPMLVSVGMYLPIDTSFAIFIGGLIKGLIDYLVKKRKLDEETGKRVSNIGILLASGLIAGEALIGILFAGLAFGEIHLPAVFAKPLYSLSMVSFVILAVILILIPLRKTRKGS